MNHRLYGMRCYLSGAMDKIKDYGAEWRDELSPFLERMGIIVLNPCKKPIHIINEMENRERRTKLKLAKEYKILAEETKTVRDIDLRMVNMSDFLILRLDTSVHTCGTYEEISWARKADKPILVWCLQEKMGLPEWLWGMIPYSHIFDTKEELKSYLVHIHTTDIIEDMESWIFFDFSKIIPIVTVEQSEKIS